MSVFTSETGWVSKHCDEQSPVSYALTATVLVHYIPQCTSVGVYQQSYGQCDSTERGGYSVEHPHKEVVGLELL